ncbi:MAG: hypothetical protein J6Y19_00590, partial [Kiritimatiellae bacterium]|nr:hypothetical protein [Kiritimatiellia bacterium]
GTGREGAGDGRTGRGRDVKEDGGSGGEEEDGGGARGVGEVVAEEAGEVGGGAWEAKVGDAGWWRGECHGPEVWGKGGEGGKPIFWGPTLGWAGASVRLGPK